MKVAKSASISGSRTFFSVPILFFGGRESSGLRQASSSRRTRVDSEKRECNGCTLIGIFHRKITLSEKLLLFGVFRKAKFSGDCEWNLNSWDICEKCGCGHLGLWHSQHGVPCWTAGLLFSFLVSSQPHKLSKLHTPQWLWLRPAKIVESYCQVESGFFMSSTHHWAVSLMQPPDYCSPPSGSMEVGDGRAFRPSDRVWGFRWILWSWHGRLGTTSILKYFRKLQKLQIFLPFLNLARV